MTFSSKDYWNKRYASGNNSGVGSYGFFATKKAEILNSFMDQNNIESVIEFGCGDGNQLRLYSMPKDFIGFDISEEGVKKCQKINPEKDLRVYDHKTYLPEKTSDLTLSIDVLYHITEDDIFEKYMKDLFDSSHKFVGIYSFENKPDSMSQHVAHRVHSEWIKKNRPEFKLIEQHSVEKNACEFFFYEKGIK